jgi:hypothetical protein
MRGSQFAPQVVDVFFAAKLEKVYFKRLQEEFGEGNNLS